MSSPFAALDRNRKKRPLPTLGKDQIKASGSLTRSNSSGSSLFGTVDAFKAGRTLSAPQTAALPAQEMEMESKENVPDAQTRPARAKKSSLTSLLRAQSKFSGRTSVVSSKSRSAITKAKKAKSLDSGANATEATSSSSDRLTRVLPWAASKSINVRPGAKFRHSGAGGHKMLAANDPNRNNPKLAASHSHLQAIDTSFDGLDLSTEQQDVLDSILNKRKNVFFTGSAGTGKSFLLKLIIRKLQTRYGNSNIGISAPTGLAASNVGGQTIQRLFGIGLGKEPADVLLAKIKKNMDKYMVWRRMVVLIIDEVSMLDSELFDKLNYLAKKIKRNEEPFGGIQVVISGDFLQLPPISKFSGASINYCFKSKSWKEVVHENIILSKVFRQQGDTELVDILNSLRIGKIDYKLEGKMRQLNRPIDFNDGIEPTELFPTREEVERSNLNKLNTLGGPELVYDCKDISTVGLAIDEKTKKSLELLMCSPSLKLKVGAQVMLIKNDVDHRLVNGQLGIVEAFLTRPILHSFHARFGQQYTAANVSVLKKISMILLNRSGVTRDPAVEDLTLVDPFTAELMEELLRSYNPKDQLLPHVRFTLKEGYPPIYILIDRSDFKPDFGRGIDSGFIRSQLPIILAWSMSIHKSQGQTLQRVKVDLRKIFEKGQLYVAISRCTSSKGLQVLNFDRRKVFVDEEVISFYNSISK